MESWFLEGELLDPGRWHGRARLRIAGGRLAALEPLPEGETPQSRPERTWPFPAGTWILPGFIDGHTHLLGVGLSPLRPDLSGAAGREEALERLAEWLARHPGSGPVLGEGWDQSDWADPVPPTRADLDRVAPDRAVALRRVCGHVAVLNSKALQLVGSEWSDLDLELGLVREELPLSLPRLWPPTEDQLDEAVLRGQLEAWRVGVTGVQEMGQANSFRAFGRAAAANRLHLRVTHFFGAGLLPALEEIGLAPGMGGDRLRAGGLKIFLDGSIGGQSAAVREPYSRRGPAGGDRGLLLWEDEKLHEVLSRAARMGLQPAMHAIGDRAIEQGIAAVERLRAEGSPLPDPGPRLEHAEMLDEPLLERGCRAGVLFSMQPNFTARWQNPGGLYESALGAERAEALNPYAQVSARGRLHFGSDTMPLDPILGLRGALTHPREAERLTLERALELYGAAAATAVSHPFGAGRLREGAWADLIALQLGPGATWEALNLTGAPAASRLDQVRVVATWVEGVLRYADPGLASPSWLSSQSPGQASPRNPQG